MQNFWGQNWYYEVLVNHIRKLFFKIRNSICSKEKISRTIFKTMKILGFSCQRHGATASVEVKKGLYGFLYQFWLNSFDQPPLQPPIWSLASRRAKKPLHFAVFMAMTAITYILLENFSFERIKIFIYKKSFVIL